MQDLTLIGSAIGAAAVGAISYLTFRSAKKEDEKRRKRKAQLRKQEYREPEKFKTMPTAQVQKAKVRTQKVALIRAYSAMNTQPLGGKLIDSQYQFQTIYYDAFVDQMKKRPHLDVKIFDNAVKANSWGADVVLDLRIHPEKEPKPTYLIVSSKKTEDEILARRFFTKWQSKYPGKVDHYKPGEGERYFNSVNASEKYILFYLGRCGKESAESHLIHDREIVIDDILSMVEKHLEDINEASKK